MPTRHTSNSSIQSQELTIQQKKWLTDESSLTEKLTKLALGNFSVTLLNQGLALATRYEQALLPNSNGPVIIREVILNGLNEPWVYARTVIPKSTLDQHDWLSSLGDRPLGRELFTRSNIHRQRVSLDHYQPDELPEGLAKNASWGRHSRFDLDEESILVSEVFLDKLMNRLC